MVTEAEARTQLERLVAHATEPTLDASEISGLLASYALPDSAGGSSSGDTAWAPTAVYALGDRVVPSSATGRSYEVTVAGTAGDDEPSWPSSGSVTSGSVTFELATSDPVAWQPSYALAAAAAEGWRMKAGLVSDRFRFADDGDSYDRQMIFEHCMRMAETYEKKAKAGEIIVGTPAGGATGAAMVQLDPQDRRVEQDETKLIVLRQRDETGEIARVN